MPLNMDGPYPLDTNSINKNVTKTSAGNYAIGYLNSSNQFVPKYVGRADSDVNDRLKDHIGEHGQSKLFKYSYASSKTEAYKKECENYHEFKSQLTNSIHPDQPDEHGKTIYCPVSSCTKAKPKD
ncbi:hypothetical protein ACKGF9_004111 [Providencia rettgeri]